MCRVALTRSSCCVLRTSVQGYKAQADLVLAHLDGLLDGCQVVGYSRPALDTPCICTLSCQCSLTRIYKPC